MQRGQQISDVQGTDVGVDQMEAFFHQPISRFLLPQLAHQEAGKKGQLFLLVSGFHQLAGEVFFPELVKIRPSRSQGGGIDSKERFQRVGFENNLDCRKRCFFIGHDAGFDDRPVEEQGWRAEASS